MSARTSSRALQVVEYRLVPIRYGGGTHYTLEVSVRPSVRVRPNSVRQRTGPHLVRSCPTPPIRVGRSDGPRLGRLGGPYQSIPLRNKIPNFERRLEIPKPLARIIAFRVKHPAAN